MIILGTAALAGLAGLAAARCPLGRAVALGLATMADAPRKPRAAR